MAASTLEDDLGNIQLRLGEVWQTFAVERALNELANEQADPELYAAVCKCGAFWQTASVALQTSMLIGIFALLDRDDPDGATLYSIVREIRKTNSTPTFVGVEARLDQIRDRYKKYRHKLFGHNDKERLEFAKKFDVAGFTWEQFGKDFLFLDYVWKAVKLASEGIPIPCEGDAPGLHFAHNHAVDQAIAHTKKLLADVRTK